MALFAVFALGVIPGYLIGWRSGYDEAESRMSVYRWKRKGRYRPK